jgi:hypothetical protein
MRTGLAALALCLCLGWAAPAGAQQPANSFWTGADPRQITFTPIDTSTFYKTHNFSNVIRTPSQQSAFNISNIFHSFSLPSWPPKIGSSPTPNLSQTPSFTPPVMPLQQQPSGRSQSYFP